MELSLPHSIKLLLSVIDLNSFSSLIYFMFLSDILLAPLDNLRAALYKSEFVFVFVLNGTCTFVIG